MEATNHPTYATTMTVNDVAYELGLGRNKGYELVREAYAAGKPFRVVMIGSQYRVVTASFFDWLSNATEAPLS